MTYHVGQVLYVVLKKETRVYPMQVIEEITKKTLTGEVKSYMVRGGTDPKAQLLISDVDGEIFDSAERAKSELIERATSSINRLIVAAVQKAQEWYSFSPKSTFDNDSLSLIKKSSIDQRTNREIHSDVIELAEELQAESNDQQITITLPDGSKAKVRSIKLPDSIS